MNKKYQERSRNNTIGWVSKEPITGKFASDPWEGQFGYNNVGEYVQYRNGIWTKVN